jgi:hypothetical protein
MASAREHALAREEYSPREEAEPDQVRTAWCMSFKVEIPLL